MNLAVLGIVYPVIFLSELPDKTMLASAVLAARGHAAAVWAGAAAAFAVHVCIAVTAGAVLVTVLPHRAVQALAAVLFLGGAVWVLRSAAARPGAAGPGAAAPGSAGRTFLTTFAVVFLAEWGDVTQILTAGLAARLHDPVAVGLGAVLALWSAATLAVAAGRPLGRLPAVLVQRVTGVILLALAAFAALAAITGR
jgi:Ca2+/H+ antiporter, TMEM165/GDT1 family